MRDTTADAERVQRDVFRGMSPAARVALAFEASEWLLAIARLRVAAPPPRESLQQRRAAATPRADQAPR